MWLSLEQRDLNYAILAHFHGIGYRLDMDLSSQYLFVSYSSQDRNKVIPFVNVLEDNGIPIWIDQNKIHGGGDHTVEIPKAIRKSCVVLFFVSSKSFQSPDVKKEISIADQKNKPIIPLRLEIVDIPDTFAYNLVGRQHITFFGRDATDVLSDVRAALKDLGFEFGDKTNKWPGDHHRVSATEHPESALTELVPYMVNRIDQELALRTAFKHHLSHRPRCPHVIMVYGKYTQAMEEYLHRLQESSLPAALRVVKKPDILKWVDMNWSRNKNWADNPEELIMRFDHEIELELNLEPGAWPSVAPNSLTSLQKALILCYRVRYDSWRDTHVTALRHWLCSWSRVIPLSPVYPLIVLFAVQYGDSKAPLLERMFHRQKNPDCHPIIAQVCELESAGASDVTVSKLPELGNVTFEDIEQWIRKHVRPPDPPAMIRKAKVILNDLDILMDAGLPMEQLGEKLETLLRFVLEGNE